MDIRDNLILKFEMPDRFGKRMMEMKTRERYLNCQRGEMDQYT